MTNTRQTIREAVRSRFRTAGPDGAFPTVAGGRVFSSCTQCVSKEDMPCILIAVRKEKVLGGVFGDGRMKYTDRELSLTITGLLIEVRPEDDIEGGEREDCQFDGRLDGFAEQIEAAMAGWEIPGYEGIDIGLTETELHVDVEGAELHGSVLLTYTIRYRHARIVSWIEEPPTPTTVMGSWAPDIGPPHEADYQEITGSQLPEFT